MSECRTSIVDFNFKVNRRNIGPPPVSMSQEDIKNLFNRDLCIICQKSRKEKVTSTENGRDKIKRAATLRRDLVYHRVNLLAENGMKSL